jgi:TolB-like protein/Tfp pilus assembly protein PilF
MRSKGYASIPASTAVSSSVPDKSIAVLPFANLSSDPENAYFAEGIQDEILTRLSKIGDLKVISRTSTLHYKSAPENLPEIARQLGVANILEGSVQKKGDAVRVNVQLIKAANDSHLWADIFDRKLTDVFTVESDVAKAIADQLRAKLTGQEAWVVAAKPTNSDGAYDAYLRALAYTNKPAIMAPVARKYLKQAVELDPKFALAWALLSYVDSVGYRTLNLPATEATREEARQAAERALTLQPNLGEGIFAKGYYHYSCLKEYDVATSYFEQARLLLPNNSLIPQSLAFVCRRRGQWQQSEAYFNEAEKVDPRNAFVLTQHGLFFSTVRRFPEAIRKLDEVLNITPESKASTREKADIAQAEGDLPRAAQFLAGQDVESWGFNDIVTHTSQAIFERHPAKVIPQLSQLLSENGANLDIEQTRFWLGWAQEQSGDHAAARQTWQDVVSKLEASVKTEPDNLFFLNYLALTCACLGDKNAALSYARRAMELVPIEKDALRGPAGLEIYARTAALTGETGQAITALQKLLSIPYEGALTSAAPLTPALLRLDPMFDSLRKDARFQKLSVAPIP